MESFIDDKVRESMRALPLNQPTPRRFNYTTDGIAGAEECEVHRIRRCLDVSGMHLVLAFAPIVFIR